MNSAKIYYDSDGNEKTIYQMIKDEPEWTASKFQEMEKIIESRQWISVKDRLPEDDLKVVILVNYSEYMFGFFVAEDEEGDPLKRWYWYNVHDKNYNNVSGNIVTHWFPIPNLPEDS